MLDASIISALTALRKRQIKAKADLAHVDALLVQMGIDPASLPVSRPYRTRHGRNYVRLIILDLLRHGPMAGRQIADIALARVPEVPPESLRPLVYSALTKMGTAGVLVRADGRWRLANLP